MLAWRVETQLVRLNLGFAVRIHEQVRRIARAGRCACRISDRVVTDIVRQVLTDKEVVGIVNCLVRRPVSIRTGVQSFQRTEAAFQRPGRVVELVLNVLWREANDVIIVQIRVGGENAIGLDLLLGVRDQQIPVFVDLVETAETEALIGNIVDVILDDVAVVGVDEGNTRQISTSLEAFAVGIHWHTIVADRTFSAETGRVTNRQCAADIVDEAALSVRIDDAAQRKLVADRNVDHRFNTVAHLTAIGERRRRIEPGIKTAQRRLVRDHANCTSLGAGAE